MHGKKENKENGFLKKPENGGIFMKKRVLSLLLCTAMTIGTLSGCGKETGNDEGKTTEVLGNDAEDEMTEVKIWHDGDENIMQTIADCANEKLAEDNIKVTFEKTSFSYMEMMNPTDRICIFMHMIHWEHLQKWEF